MRFSVIVPVYKVEPYLHRCVQSVLEQSFEEFQLVLVDDGSPDRCGQLCDEYAQRDDRIKAIHMENGGVSAARNRGLEEASGEYIVFLDADDALAPGFLKAADRILREEPAADLVQFCWRSFPNGAPLPETAESVSAPVCHENQDAMRQFLQFRVFNQAPWGKVLHRSLMEGLRFPVGVRIGEDLAVSYRWLSRARRIISTGAVAYYYCLRPSGAMGSMQLDGIRDAFGVYEQMYRFLIAEYPALRGEILKRYADDLMQLIRDTGRMPAAQDAQQLRREISDALSALPAIANRKTEMLRWLLLHCPPVYCLLYRMCKRK